MPQPPPSSSACFWSPFRFTVNLRSGSRASKITYRSRVGDLDIPAWVFQPLKLRGDKGHPAIVWVHENIRGHLYEHYIPYIREATAKGYIVIAPEYRGSIGYGKAF